jgi:hypothetical protein
MYTPGLSDVLQIQPISVTEWLQLLAFAMSLLIVEELHKVLIRWRRSRAGPARHGRQASPLGHPQGRL